MLHPVRQRMVDVFGAETIGDVRTPNWTRIRFDEFDLRKEAAYVLQATDLIRAVTFAVFARSPEVTAILNWQAGDSTDLTPPFDDLEALGFEATSREPDVRIRQFDADSPADDYWTHTRYIRLKADLETLAPLFMTAVTTFGRPGPYTNLWFELVDFEQGLAIEYYDNRGMVLYATRPEPLAPVYERFRDQVYEPEIERCDALFGPLLQQSRPRLSLVDPRP